MAESPSPAPPPAAHQYRLDTTPLQEIQSNPALKFLLKDWERQSKGLRLQMQHKESQSSRNYTEAFCIFMFHLAFQGALLAVVGAEHGSIGCRNLWAPISLSLLAAFPMGLALWHKFAASENLESQLQEERAILRDLHGSIQHLKVRGKNFELKTGVSGYSLPRKKLCFTKGRLGLILGYPGSIIFVFISFTAVILVSCNRILCDPGP